MKQAASLSLRLAIGLAGCGQGRWGGTVDAATPDADLTGNLRVITPDARHRFPGALAAIQAGVTVFLDANRTTASSTPQMSR